MTKIVLGVILLAALGVGISMNSEKKLPSFRRLFQMMMRTSDDYKPLFTDTVDLSHPGIARSYNLMLREGEIYEIGLLDPTGMIPASYLFKGQIKVEFHCDGNVVREDLISKMGTRWYTNQQMTHYKRIQLLSFQWSDPAITCDNLKLRMSIVKGDPGYQELSTKPVLYVGISPTP